MKNISCPLLTSGVIYNHIESTTLTLRQANVDSLESTDLEILTCLVQHSDIAIEDLHTFTNYSISRIHSSIARLERHGLVTRPFGRIKTSNSTEGFLSIVKHLIGGDQWRLLLQSDYYSHMLKDTIHDLIAMRFHYKIQDEFPDFLRKFALLSPKAASYILFGDTSLYDNLAEQARTLGDQQIAMANEMIMRNILQNVLMSYAEDSINAKLIDTLDGRVIAGQIITMRVAGAYEDGLAFEAHSVMPLMRVRASTNLNKGQMVSGSPSLFVQIGTILMHMGEFDLAEKEFDKVLNPEMPSDVRAAAMNNKGLIFLNRGQVSKAVDFFRQSSELNPNLSEPRKNLEVAESMLGEKR